MKSRIFTTIVRTKFKRTNLEQIESRRVRAQLQLTTKRAAKWLDRFASRHRLERARKSSAEKKELVRREIFSPWWTIVSHRNFAFSKDSNKSCNEHWPHCLLFADRRSQWTEENTDCSLLPRSTLKTNALDNDIERSISSSAQRQIVFLSFSIVTIVKCCSWSSKLTNSNDEMSIDNSLN